MKRKTGTPFLVIAAAIAATAAVGGCAAATSTSDGTLPRAMSSPVPLRSASPTPQPASLTPEQRADADTASILASFVAPPGAVALHGVARAQERLLGGPASKPGTPDLVDDASWWRVPGQMEAVLAWEKAHLPGRFSASGSGTSYAGGHITAVSEVFSLPEVADILSQRQLQVQAAADGPGQVLVRVDAQDTWLPAKPAADKVPSAATVVTIAPVPGPNARGKPPAPSTITDPSTVKRIVALINGLPIYPPGAFSCAMSTGQGLRLTFREGAGGPVVAVATAEIGGCLSADLVVEGKSQPALSEASTSVTKALGIAGLKWPGY